MYIYVYTLMRAQVILMMMATTIEGYWELCAMLLGIMIYDMIFQICRHGL